MITLIQHLIFLTHQFTSHIYLYLFPLKTHLYLNWANSFLRWELWIGNSFWSVLSWEFNWVDSKQPIRNPFFDYQNIYVSNVFNFYAIVYFYTIPLQICNEFFCSRLRWSPINICLSCEGKSIFLLIWFWEPHYPIRKFQKIKKLRILWLLWGFKGKIYLMHWFSFCNFAKSWLIIEESKFNWYIIHSNYWIK